MPEVGSLCRKIKLKAFALVVKKTPLTFGKLFFEQQQCLHNLQGSPGKGNHILSLFKWWFAHAFWKTKGQISICNENNLYHLHNLNMLPE